MKTGVGSSFGNELEVGWKHTGASSPEQKKKSLYLGLIIIGSFAFGVVIIILLSIQNVGAMPTQSNMGISDSIDYSYYDTIYQTEFENNCYDIDLMTLYPHGQFIYQASALWADSDSTLEQAYAHTRPLTFDEKDYDLHGAYLLEIAFKPLSENYYGYGIDTTNPPDGKIDEGHYYYIFDYPDFGLYITGHRELYVKRVINVGTPQNPALQVRFGDFDLDTTLSQGTEYVIWVVSYEDLQHNFRNYDIYIDQQFIISIPSNYKDGFSDMFFFGDWDSTPHDLEPRGQGYWNYFTLLGHTYNNCRFFDNFQDQSATNWREVDRSTSSLWETNLQGQESFLHLQSSGSAALRCNGKSPFIDYYDPNGNYYISFDFKFTSEDVLVIMSNNEIRLILSHHDLMFETGGNWIKLCTLSSNQWYFIEIFREEPEPPIFPAGTFTVYVDYENKGLNLPFANAGQGTEFIEIGDFDNNQRIWNAYWDNIRVTSDASLQSSGFGTNYQAAPHIQTFMEDFECFSTTYDSTTYNLDIEETGWFMSPAQEDTANVIWQIGQDNTFGAHTGNKIVKTKLNAQYPNSCEGMVVTPNIDLYKCSSATLNFWIKYDTEAHHDGMRIQTRSWNAVNRNWDSWTDLGIGLGFYNDNNVTAWSNGEAFSGDSNGWIEEVLSINSLCGNNQGSTPHRYQFAFYFKSDSNSVQDWGIGIDDIKIFGIMTTGTDADLDDDGLTNLEEFYTYRTNPLYFDSDWDGISDNDETHTIQLVNIHMWEFGDEFNPTDPLKKDIVVEIDSMETDAHVSLLTEDMRNQLENQDEDFGIQGIDLHLVYSNLNIEWDASSNDTDLDNTRNTYFGLTNQAFYCFIANEYSTTGVYGVEWEGRSRAPYALFTNPIFTDSNVLFFEEVFSHELGHGIGMRHYPNNFYTDNTDIRFKSIRNWSPSFPGHGSMENEMVDTTNGYLGELSNTQFSYQEWEYNDDPRIMDFVLRHTYNEVMGGWEYGAMFNDGDPGFNEVWFYGPYYFAIRDYTH